MLWCLLFVAGAAQPWTWTQDFESAPIGPATSKVIHSLFPGAGGIVGAGSRGHVIEVDGNQVLKVSFPAGATSQRRSGLNFVSNLTEAHHEELFLQYRVWTPENFDPVLGGKLPSFAAGIVKAGTPVNGLDGWSTRLMWRPHSVLSQYMYYPDMSSSYGEVNYWQSGEQYAALDPGNWVTITIHLKLNTPGEKNGFLKAWCNSEPVLNMQSLRLRDTNRLPIQMLKFNTFYGGSKPQYAPKKPMFLYFDDFIVSTEMPALPAKEAPKLTLSEADLPGGTTRGHHPPDPVQFTGEQWHFTPDLSNTPPGPLQWQAPFPLPSWRYGSMGKRATLQVQSGEKVFVVPTAVAGKREADVGVRFNWMLPTPGRTVVLEYQVMLKEGHSRGQALRLPGLLGGDPVNALPNGRNYYRTLVSVSREGALESLIFSANTKEMSGTVARWGAASLPVGKWTTIKQQLTVNHVGQSDGSLKVWVNGQEVLSEEQITFTRFAMPIDALHFVVRGVGSFSGTTSNTVLIKNLQISKLD